MVRLEVVEDDVAQLPGLHEGPQLLDEPRGEGLLPAVDEHRALLGPDEVGIVGYALGYLPEGLEEPGVGVVDAQEVDTLLYLLDADGCHA